MSSSTDIYSFKWFVKFIYSGISLNLLISFYYYIKSPELGEFNSYSIGSI